MFYLAGNITNLFQKWGAGFVIKSQNVSSYLNKIRLKFSFVPFIENLRSTRLHGVSMLQAVKCKFRRQYLKGEFINR